MKNIEGVRRGLSAYFTDPVVIVLAKTRITPNTLTWLGFLLALVAAWLVSTGQMVAGGIMVLVAGLFDMLDGALARKTEQTTAFGAVLDSTLDRLSEAALLAGIVIFYAGTAGNLLAILATVALVFSFMVSYLRARAEALGLKGNSGFFTRPERVVVLALSLLLVSVFSYAIHLALAIIILLSLITAIQRMLSIRRQLG
ncbi:CDP-alcohol phosphatidyltransferase family protein [Chloroflexota bacterium]